MTSYIRPSTTPPFCDYTFPVVVEHSWDRKIDHVTLPSGEVCRVCVAVWGKHFPDGKPLLHVSHGDGTSHHSPLTVAQMAYHLRERAGLAPTSKMAT